MAWMTIHFGRNPRNGGSPPKDRSDVNSMNFISVISLFVIIFGLKEIFAYFVKLSFVFCWC
jgi:hypothetical protein